MVERPALADVLAALSECPIDTVRGWLRGCDQQRMRPAIEATETGGVGLCVRGHFADGTRGWLFPLRDATPAEALAALVEADAVPEHWTDAARAPRWWCEGCSVCGTNPWVPDGQGFVERETCFACDERGYATPAPPSHAALVAVASLGRATLARAEAIVAETWPGARLVWRAMTAEEPGKHWSRVAAGSVFSLRAAMFEASGESDDDMRARYAALGAPVVSIEAIAALGLHLVDLDAGRVVLAVEALS